MNAATAIQRPEAAPILSELKAIAADFAADRQARQARRHLEHTDFDRLAEAGFLRTGIPASMGGLWSDTRSSVRLYCDMVRIIAGGDPSVALVASMHPSVLVFWLAAESAPPADDAAWQEQRNWCFDTAREGHWWGTVTSEPGSGGDIMKTRTLAQPTGAPNSFCLTGEKHFGSGSGITSFMITTAKVAQDAAPSMFFMDMRDMPWDGSKGVTLAAEWDGHGMSATQSHAFHFDGVEATQMAWPGGVAQSSPAAAQLGACMFTAVVVGVIESALAYARGKLQPRKDGLRSFERVEWARAVNEVWTILQIHEGMVAAVESGAGGVAASARGKAIVAELAEVCLARMSKVVGGSSFSRSAPLGQWGQDVRALGFLRPPWGLAFDQLYDLSWKD
ncbi:MAG: acyl-CoA dehydrogenase family protein [Parvibaculum sp.]|uniref:acyl-CoA dehydrogenase family protein n=1 Tax=Parvibaculum sp. TaxID=2024848 RepID=UPI0032EF41C0